jgi:TPR repeat protein
MAFKLLLEAAESGLVDAQFNLAHLHHRNDNIDMAVLWFGKAASQGNTDAEM